MSELITKQQLAEIRANLRGIYDNSKIQIRYSIIICVMQTYCGNKIKPTASFLGISKNTVKKALHFYEKREQVVAGKPGPESIIREEHQIYIEAMTLTNPRLTDQDLACMLVENFDNITHCSETTVI